jgi:hypothetical protein
MFYAILRIKIVSLDSNLVLRFLKKATTMFGQLIASPYNLGFISARGLWICFWNTLMRLFYM